jgi:hypothetical protein
VHHRFGRSSQNDRLDAILVIEMGMHRRDGDVVMIVLHGRQSARKLPFVMVVNVT